MARYSAVEGCTSSATEAAYQWIGRFGPQPTQQNMAVPGQPTGQVHTCVFEAVETVSDSQAKIVRYCRSNTSAFEQVHYRMSFNPPPCGLVDYPDALSLSWYVVGAWVATYAIKWLARIVRDR